MAEANSERLHALDAVRGFALLAGIVFHATVSFLPAPAGVPLWIVMDSHRSLTLGVVFYGLHIFRMTTFFLIAGFFAHLMVERRGVGGFVRDRIKRIAVPLLVGWPIVIAAIIAVSIWGAVVMAHGRPLPPAPAYPGFPSFPLTHLWFLYLLLWLYAATLGLRAVVNAVDRSGAVGRMVDRTVSWIARNPLGALPLAAPACAALYFTPKWMMWFGIPTPDSSLVPNLGAGVAFFVAFGFGWLVHRQSGLIETLRGRWRLNLALGLGLAVAGLAITGAAPMLTPSQPGLAKLVFAACYALASLRLTFAAIGLALRFLSSFSPARRYIADASYWLYIIHLPIILAL
ncbi:MAG: acyltransferase family protein [Caulobacterales bacterium]